MLAANVSSKCGAFSIETLESQTPLLAICQTRQKRRCFTFQVPAILIEILFISSYD